MFKWRSKAERRREKKKSKVKKDREKTRIDWCEYCTVSRKRKTFQLCSKLVNVIWGRDKAGRCLSVSFPFFYFCLLLSLLFISKTYSIFYLFVVVYVWVWRKHMHVMTHIAQWNIAKRKKYGRAGECVCAQDNKTSKHTTSESDKFDMSFIMFFFFFTVRFFLENIASLLFTAQL